MRVATHGYELNLSGQEWFKEVNQSGNYGVYSTSLKHSGNASVRFHETASQAFHYISLASGTNQSNVFYFRMYFAVATAPASQAIICGAIDQGFSNKISIKIDTDNTLTLWNTEDNAQIGSASAALTANTFYCIELKVNTTTPSSTSVDARINETSFASGTANLATGIAHFVYGQVGTQTSDYYVDDVAINDSTGSFCNSWCGLESVAYYHPNAAGDNADFTGSYTDIDEENPNDATDFIVDKVLNHIFDANIESPIGIGANDIINVVHVCVRFSGDGASANSSFVVRIKASSGGTVEESSAYTPNNTNWNTNKGNITSDPSHPLLTIYDLPGASTTAIKKSDLETTQIGARISTANTNNVRISTMWVVVGYVPVPKIGPFATFLPNS